MAGNKFPPPIARGVPHVSKNCRTTTSERKTLHGARDKPSSLDRKGQLAQIATDNVVLLLPYNS